VEAQLDGKIFLSYPFIQTIFEKVVMSLAPRLKISSDYQSVSIWSEPVFGKDSAHQLRSFIERSFTVPQIKTIEINQAGASGKLYYTAAQDVASIWRNLSLALRRPSEIHARTDSAHEPRNVSHLFLDSSRRGPLRIIRIGNVLSTWTIRRKDENWIRFSHPVLRGRRDILFRLEEELAKIFGIEDIRPSLLTAGVSIRFDPARLEPEQLADQLEQAWPRLLNGLAGPPSAKRFLVTGGLLGLASASQFAVPALKPVALAGVALYGAPNIGDAVKQLRRRHVGLSALYATGLIFTLIAGSPLSSAIIAVLTQLWPQLTHKTIARQQRRFFAPYRRRPNWARVIGADRRQRRVRIAEVQPDQIISLRAGDIVPVDGVVTEGFGVVVDRLSGGPIGLDVGVDDTLNAGAVLVEGKLTARVLRVGDSTAAAGVAAALPHRPFDHLPSSATAERIAHRNARPALALSLFSLLTTRVLRRSQAIIRPDYATAPRLSAQLEALYDFARALQKGILFRSPGALDQIGKTDVFVIDNTAGFERRRVSIDNVVTDNASVDDVVSYAASLADSASGLRYGLEQRSVSIKSDLTFDGLHLLPGLIRLRDGEGRPVEIVSGVRFRQAGIKAPAALSRAAEVVRGDGVAGPRPVWIVRDGTPIGVVTFARRGEHAGKAIVDALRISNPHARFAYLSGDSTTRAADTAAHFGIEQVFGGLDSTAKAGLLRSLADRSVWIGNGALAEATPVVAASGVSVSTAGLSVVADDAADILLLRGDASGLLDLQALSKEHRAELKTDYGIVYLANLLGVAGAYLARFGSLQSGLISNLGTGIIYARHASRLSALVSEAEAHHAELVAWAHRGRA
jgi:cation transport ATPase